MNIQLWNFIIINFFIKNFMVIYLKLNKKFYNNFGWIIFFIMYFFINFIFYKIYDKEM